MSLFHRRDPAIEKLLELYRSPERYRAVRELGEGGLAKVSACFDTYLSRVVALKELKESNLENSFLVRSFLNEARMVGYLNHPGIVAVFDTFILDKGRVCYTMTMVEGESLAGILDSDNLFRKGPRMSMVKALDVITRVVETMAYAHERGVMHLDIKPENIMVGTYGDIKLMDWATRAFTTPSRTARTLRNSPPMRQLRMSTPSAVTWCSGPRCTCRPSRPGPRAIC